MTRQDHKSRRSMDGMTASLTGHLTYEQLGHVVTSNVAMDRQTVSCGHTHHCIPLDVHVDDTDGERRMKKIQGFTSCLSALIHKLTPSCGDDEEQHRMEPRPPIGRHLQLRQSYQLTDNSDDAGITHIGDESCGSGADDVPVAAANKPRAVLLRKSKPFEEDFMVVTVAGFLTMKPISSTQDTDARFLKKDYTLDDGQYAATFMNLKTKTYVAVNQDSQVHLCKLAGDPQSCPHPCLFIMRDTGTIQLLPTEIPEKYLGYRGSMVEVTDDISSFKMLPDCTDTPVADHRDHAVRVWGLKATTSRVEPHSSCRDFDMADDYHVHKRPVATIPLYHQEHHHHHHHHTITELSPILLPTVESKDTGCLSYLNI